MSQASSPTAVMVMTARGPDRILAEGGSQAWVLNPANARRHPYVVCVQNRHNGNWGGATEPHNTAFLIGRISSVEPSPETPGRYIVRMSEYARIAVPVVWPGRNPVRYVTLSDFEVDPATLEWTPMPGPTVEDAESVEEDEHGEPLAPEVSPESIAGIIPEFRARIAAILGADPAKVRITIET